MCHRLTVQTLMHMRLQIKTSWLWLWTCWVDWLRAWDIKSSRWRPTAICWHCCIRVPRFAHRAELLQFLMEYVTWPRDLDLWPLVLEVMSRDATWALGCNASLVLHVRHTWFSCSVMSGFVDISTIAFFLMMFLLRFVELYWVVYFLPVSVQHYQDHLRNDVNCVGWMTWHYLT